MLLALTMLSPLALYTSRLPAALNPIRKRALPQRDLFRDLRPSFVGIGALTILLPCFFSFPETRDFPGEITNQVSGFSFFFLFLFWSVDLGFYGDFVWGFDVFLFGLNGVLGPWRQDRQAECASSGKFSLPFLGIFLDQGDELL